jgi:ANTAR domain
MTGDLMNGRRLTDNRSHRDLRRIEQADGQLDVGQLDIGQPDGLTRPRTALTGQLAMLGRMLAAETVDADAARTALLDGVVQAMPATCWASLTLAGGNRRPVTMAATDGIARTADSVQYGVGAGPCLQAVAEATTVRVEDLAVEERWPSFVATALTHTPVRAVVSCSLADGGQNEVSLNLYSAVPLRGDQPDLDTVSEIAAACSVGLSAIAQRHRADHLEKALDTGRRIGAAIGILMATRRLTEQQAFDALRVTSQHSQRKLRDVAEDVLLTGELPTGTLPWHSSRTGDRAPRSARPAAQAHAASRPAEHSARPDTARS